MLVGAAERDDGGRAGVRVMMAAMFVLALTRAHRPREGAYRDATPSERSRDELAGLLASTLGGVAYDWFLRLGGPPPWILGSDGDADGITRRAEALASIGLECVVVREGERTIDLRGPIEVQPEVLVVRDGKQLIPTQTLTHAVLAVLASEVTTESTESILFAEVQRRQFPIPRTTRTRTHRKRRALYLLSEDGPAVRLVQGEATLMKDGPPSATSHQRFEELLAALRDTQPQLTWDTRLEDAPRRRTDVRLGQGGKELTSSTDREVDRMAHVIATALARRALDPWEEPPTVAR